MARLCAASLLLLVACTDVPQGHFACETDDGCPAGWFCRADDLCWSTGDPLPDAGDAERPDAQDAMPDVAVDASGDSCVPIAVEPKLDILFVVDDSGSMQEEQALLRAELPRMLESLTLGTAGSGDTFPPVRDIHVGVVSTDLGTSGFPLATCDGDGGDGVLIRGDCGGLPPFLAFRATGFSEFLGDTQCKVALGTTGCGFEQQLEAGLKALVPSTSDLRFDARAGGSELGHGDGLNAGFVRDDSLLLVVQVTDESDCSAANAEIFNPSNTTFSPHLNLRCGLNEAELHPLSRYVDGLVEAVRGRRAPDQVVVASLVGIPDELVGESAATILADERMEFRVNSEMETQFVPSCSRDTRTVAFPPRRFVQLARDLEAAGSHAVLGSICAEDYVGFFDAVLTEVAALLPRERCE